MRLRYVAALYLVVSAVASAQERTTTSVTAGPSESAQGCTSLEPPRSAKEIGDRLVRRSSPCIQVEWEVLRITATATEQLGLKGRSLMAAGGKDQLVVTNVEFGNNEMSLAGSIVERVGVQLALSVGGKHIKTVTVKNYESAVIPFAQSKSGNARIALKVTPSLADAPVLNEEPPDSETTIELFGGTLIRNGREVLRDGGGVSVSATGCFGFVDPQGRVFVLSLVAFCRASRDGYIDGRRLYFSVGEDYYTWTAQNPILKGDALRPVHVRELPVAEGSNWLGPLGGRLRASRETTLFAQGDPPECE